MTAQAATVLEILREYIGGEMVSPAVRFEDLKIDSLEFIQIVQDVEKTFNITIPNDSLPRIRTVDDLITEAARLSS